LAEENPGITEFVSERAHSHHNLGLVLKQAGNWAAAEAEFRAAVAWFQKAAADNPSVAEFRNGLAFCHDALGLVRAKPTASGRVTRRALSGTWCTLLEMA
jgi:hypothetical protein